ncbi:MFS transporter [Modicisalibacter coralii]|uniref:MFS transporter n=1 Tax=Modicisalibacter coralii TaxID=2304602 RepID=UPI0013969363|nr:MFS transporter [Halomonas coralii]
MNLWISGGGAFINVVAMTLMLPFLPAYLETLDDYSTDAVYLWSGAIYSATFITAALLAPLWGKLSDRYGCRLNLVRASLGMFVCMTLMGLATSAWQLALLRLLTGVAGGYASGATILMAREAPAERSGYAQGALSACILAGSLVGPALGGILAAHVGMREALLITGSLIFVNVLATALLIRERVPPGRRVSQADSRPATTRVRPAMLAVLVATAGLMVATLSIEPIISTVVAGLDNHGLAMASAAGLVLSATALGSLISSLRLGTLADRYGARRVAIAGLLVSIACIVPQAFVDDLITLTALRFAMGLALGGVLPCLKAALRELGNDAAQLGVVLGWSTAFQYLGQVLGPLLGSIIAAGWGMPHVFVATALVSLACALLLAAIRDETAPATA